MIFGSCIARTQLIYVALGFLFWAGSASGQALKCSDFQQLIHSTYNFEPAKLNEAQQTDKSNAMDRVWEAATSNQAELIPCLRAALSDPQANNFFLFDGSNLLASLDKSPAATATVIRSYALVNLDDVDLRVWVTNLSRFASQGFDVSEPAEKWLRYPKAFYFLPKHGAYKVTLQDGALFLYGSMDEAQATPALKKIVQDKRHPGREIALFILAHQATPESLEILKQVKSSEFSPVVQAAISAFSSHPEVFEPRVKPKTTREEFIKAFEKLVAGFSLPFSKLVSEVPDGERDVVAVLTTEDLPLVRKVRRTMIASGTPESIEFYDSFSKIILTMQLKSKQVH